MSNIVQQIVFSGSGLNTDDSNLFMPMGDSPYRLHATVSEDGLNGVLTFMKGNKQVDYISDLTLANVYFTLGSYYNALTRKLYFFIFSQPYLVSGTTYQYDNRLLCLNEDTETVDTIFLDTKNYFGLDPKQHLTDIKMIETWLFFNPVTDEPKMIDVDMAYNYTNYPAWDDTDASASAVMGDKYTWRGGLFVANTAITAGGDPSANPTKWDRIGDSYQDESSVGLTDFSTAFLAIKTPPIDRIKFSYASDTDKNFNNLQGRVFRFCHRYQYFDNSYSVCSSHSDLTLPVDDEIYSGERIYTAPYNNYLKLTFSLYSAALVKNIEIFFQEIDGDWKRMTIINRRSQTLLDETDYSYSFYNNETYPTVPQELIYKIYDAVPKRAGGQEIINKNVLCYAKCTEGFDNIDKDLIDVTLSPELEAITEFTDEDTLKHNNIPTDITYSESFDDPSNTWYKYTIIDIGTWFAGAGVATNDVYKGTLDGATFYKTLVAGDVDTAIHLAQAISSLFQNSSVYAAGGIVQVQILDNWNLPQLTVSRIYTPITLISDTSLLSKYGSFKGGAYHPFCLFYKDKALRRGDAQVADGMSVYVESLNEYSPPLETTNHRWKINWEVNHEPPTWATYWQWGYAGNRKCSYFVQYIVASLADSDPAAEETDVANTVKIDLTPLQTIRTTVDVNENCFPNSIIPAYEFTEGDRIRFVTEKVDPLVIDPSPLDSALGYVITGTYDFEIIKFEPTTNMAYVQMFDFDAANIGENSLAEIYTPIKGSSALDETETLTYYEFGDLYPIALDADGNRVHGGAIQNQSLTSSPVPATGVFENGDVYVIYRTPSKPLNEDPDQLTVGAFHESKWWSDFYNSEDWNKGKLGLEGLVGEVTQNIIRHSNVYLQNTAINGITTFDVNNYKELNDTFGNIISIVEVGDTLKCYQEKKPSSIQIGRTEYFDADGRGQAVQTQSFILGSIRYSNTNFGTIFPESICKNNRYVYGFDVYNGVLWRDSANGIFPISGRYADIGQGTDYKMMSYFKSKSKALLTSGVDHCHVLTVWDEEYKMLYVVFKDTVDNANNETIVFHEPSDRWITFADFTYTPSESWNEILELEYDIVKGFENGLGYEFDEETRFAVFNIGTGLGTSTAIGISPVSVPLRLTIPTPVVTCTADVVPTFIPLVLTVPTPSVHVSWVVADDLDMEWTDLQYGLANKIDTTLTVVGSAACTLQSAPSWIDVYELVHSTEIGGETSILTGTTLGITPNTVNTGAERSGSVIFDDAYGNTTTIAVRQLTSAANPSVAVQVIVTDPVQPMTIYDASGSGTNGSAVVDITFTPDVTGKSYNEEYSLYYTITKNAITAGVGTLTGIRDERANVKSLTMTSNAAGGDVIIVYLQYLLIES